MQYTRVILATPNFWEILTSKPPFAALAPRQFDVLAKDTDTPMVRRAVAFNVGNFAGVVEGHLLLSDVVPVFEALASDDQDSVRLLAVEQAGKVAKALVDQVINSYR